MKMDKLDDFFSHEPLDETPQVEIEEPVLEISEAEAEPINEVIEEPEAQVEETTTKGTTVPLGAIQAERAKTRQAIDDANALRQQIAALQAAQQTKNTPDPYDDPQAYNQYQQGEIARQVAEQVAMSNFTHSRNRAFEKYGAEFMEDVAKWGGEYAAANPEFEARMLAQADPAEWVIQQKKRSEELSSFDADRAAFIRAEALKMGFVEVAAPATMDATSIREVKKTAGPASIVNAKSRDAAEVENPKDAFDDIFSKKK
ncbi:hypothetical protein VH567_07845 [Sphingomonas sp. 4RDLI-65]|uniref:hypothetical protein n=1 Tax=Sphingomonas sp. 4RDLI-65 TaxID=3111641 RepID=UPI003C185783